MNIKKCPKCKKNKDEFGKDKHTKDLLTWCCIVCLREARKENYAKNKEILKERKRLWNKNNPEKVRETKSRWYAKNSEKEKRRQKMWRENNPDEAKERDRINGLKKYNITEKIYNEMLVKQNNLCAICKKNRYKLTKNLSVDHCHKTNRIRGLLCHHCNLALGLLGDNIETLKNTIKYLKKFV